MFSLCFIPLLHTSVLNVRGCVDISIKYALPCRVFYFVMQLFSGVFLPFAVLLFLAFYDRKFIKLFSISAVLNKVRIFLIKQICLGGI